MEKLINEFDEIIRWPKKSSDKERVVRFLAIKFNFDSRYTEKEVNAIIEKYHSFKDIALLRRELVSRKLLYRRNDGSVYWRIK